MRTAIIYGSKYGSTGKVAGQINQNLGGRCKIYNLDDHVNIDLSQYDRLILGSPIYIGKIQKSLRKFCEVNESSILTKEVFVFLCSKFEEEETVKSNFSDELYKHISHFQYLGSVIDMSKLSLIEKGISKIIKEKGHDNLNEDVIKGFTDQIN